MGRGLYAICAITLFTYVVIFYRLAVLWNNPHLLNRAGSLLSATGAVLVILQVIAEERFAAGNERDREAMESAEILPAYEDLAIRVAAARTFGRELRRMRIVICIAIVIVLGEILHGWGDIIVERLDGHQTMVHDVPTSPD